MQVRTRVQGDELIEGALQCRGCGRTYPVVEGLPILLAEPQPALDLLAAHATEELLAAGPDAAQVPHAAAQLSTYLDASWGDCATPPPGGPGEVFGFVALALKLRALPAAGLTLELGCGAGRGLAELSARASRVIGLDGNPWMLRAARTLLRTGELSYLRRMIGRAYAPAQLRTARLRNVDFICGDALDPPFPPGAFDRVVALNLVDNVRSPRALLHHLAQLAASEVALCTPYAFRDAIVPFAEQLDGEGIVGVLRERGFEVLEEDPRVRWTLRHDARAATAYDVHWLRARAT